MTPEEKMNAANAYAGKVIRSARQAQNLSMEALASKAKVTYQQLQKYERGINNISLGKAALFAEALKISPAMLFTGDNTEVPIIFSQSKSRVKALQQIKAIVDGVFKNQGEI